MNITYKLVRSSRKTLAVEIKGDGQVIVRAPYRTSKREIDRFVIEKADWIEKHLSAVRERQEARPAIKKITAAEIRALADVPQIGNEPLGKILGGGGEGASGLQDSS